MARGATWAIRPVGTTRRRRPWRLLYVEPGRPYLIQPNQQFRIEDLSGAGLDTLVRLRIVHSDKCLAVAGASQAAGTVVVQFTCTQPAPAHFQWYLRPVP